MSLQNERQASLIEAEKQTNRFGDVLLDSIAGGSFDADIARTPDFFLEHFASISPQGFSGSGRVPDFQSLQRVTDIEITPE
jgi:hypothetical protein